MKELILQVDEGGTRLDLALLRALSSEISRSQLKVLFKDHQILMDGRTVAASTLLSSGRKYKVTLLKSILPQDQVLATHSELTIPIVFEDSHLLILDKPSGVPSVPHQVEETGTAVNFALKHFPGMAKIGRGGLEPGLVHRLDTGTSGLLVFAKTQNEFERLSEVWKKREIRKIYRAKVSGDLKKFQTPHLIDLPLAHDAKSSKRMIPVLEKTRPSFYRGKPLVARTWIQAVHGEGDLEIEIETGVMHQIRCHLASQGLPILGDSIYRGTPADRLYLHAWQLIFQDHQGKEMKVEATLPMGWSV